MLPDEKIQSTFCDCGRQFCGYDLFLVEQSDFGEGTSQRSIKLVHAGVRYLQQGNIEWENEKVASFQRMGERYLPGIQHDSEFGMNASKILENQPKQFNGIRNLFPNQASLLFPSTSR